MRSKWIATVVMFACSAGWAQTSPAPKPCSAPEYRQLDFWVGDWDLTTPAKAGGMANAGINHVVRLLDDCVIQENFDGGSTGPLRGMSVSLYNAQLKKWQQTWVDNQGAYLDFTGEFKDGEMVLSREFTKNGKKIMQRMVYKNIKSDSLDWSWERSDDGGSTWKVVWPIHYQRRKA